MAREWFVLSARLAAREWFMLSARLAAREWLTVNDQLRPTVNITFHPSWSANRQSARSHSFVSHRSAQQR